VAEGQEESMTTTTPPGTGLATAPAAGQVARQEFGAHEMTVSAEMAASAAAAQATAIVQARYVMALKKPRDWDDVRVKLMREVERPGFADVAWYRKPIGAGVEGLSIRFAEAAMRCMTNLLPESPVIYDDPSRRIIRVTLTDLESNLTWTKDVVIEKTVERRSLRRGQTALQVRTNSSGETTYLVSATEDELMAKEGAIVSKTMRTLALRILPGDLQDEAKKRILAIRSGDAAKDPDGARKKIVDAFAVLNVMPSDLKRYLGHEISTASPAEVAELRDVYSAIHAGETTWADALAEKVDQEEPAAPAEKKTGIDAVTEKLETKAPAPVPASPQATTPGGPVCPDHPTQTIENGNGSRQCFADDCKWTSPAPVAAQVEPTPREAVEALSEKAGDTTKARGRQGRLQD
jgi:hypothetical protein